MLEMLGPRETWGGPVGGSVWKGTESPGHIFAIWCAFVEWRWSSRIMWTPTPFVPGIAALREAEVGLGGPVAW